MPTTNYHIGPTDSLTQTLKSAQPGSVIHLAPGLYDLGAYQYMREPPPTITVQAENPTNPPIIYCPATLQITGSQSLTFQNIIIDGRINLDNVRETRNNGGARFDRVQWRFTSTKVSTKDMLKLAHVPDVVVTDSQFIRTVGVTDRPVDCVGPYRLLVNRCYFQDPLQGAIQIKGGARWAIVRQSIVNCTKPSTGLGQRAVQIGGSSCYECFGWDPGTGDPLYPQDVQFEAINCLVEDNLFFNCVTPLAASTSRGTIMRNNTAYWDPRFGAMWLWRFLQEDANQDKPGFPLMAGQRELKFYGNLFLYRVGHINGSVQNSGGPGAPQAFDTFDVRDNAFYATSPITNPIFGVQGGYPHRHPAALPPNGAVDYRKNWLDQVNPLIRDWGMPTMSPTAQAYVALSAAGDGAVRVGCRETAGPVGFTYPDGAQPQPPIEKDAYPAGTPFYGWEGPGSAQVIVEPPPPDPGPSPVIEFHVTDWEGRSMAIFPDLESARDYRAGLTIERVARVEVGDGDDQ